MDTDGQTIDFLLTARRDAAAALRFFRKAIRNHGEPEVVTIDKSGANTAALATLNADNPEEDAITIRQSRYLNNRVEQDHRNIVKGIISICKVMDCHRQNNFICWLPEKQSVQLLPPLCH